ncbi:Ubiquitin-like protein pmt3/smt3 [Carex littledalei]|uniref:Ubiquitin-like protein pmt3/smt3 n=1 Tax=Carex littledalei TaxID=544730 RepID=A0A833RBH1_9POAL|nr:Ubiquitin-like protein pmt3/smt3 [Carex littledalei]
MDEGNEELEALFDYTRVQPALCFTFDDSDIEKSEIFVHCRKKLKRTTAVEAKEGLKGTGDYVSVPEDKNNSINKENEEDDWLAPPPPKTLFRTEHEEDSIRRELRLTKKELVSLATPIEDVLKDLTENAKAQVKSSKKSAKPVVLDLPSEVREKIVISIQDKDDKKQFCIYKDDKFEKLFKIYAKKINIKPEDLVFSFDGEKVGPASTPASLELEDDDMLEVHVKSRSS